MENKVYELLDKLKIEYSKVEHPPVFTVKDSEKYNIKLNSLKNGRSKSISKGAQRLHP